MAVSRSALVKQQIFIALMQCSSYVRTYVDGGEVERKNKAYTVEEMACV